MEIEVYVTHVLDAKNALSSSRLTDDNICTLCLTLEQSQIVETSVHKPDFGVLAGDLRSLVAPTDETSYLRLRESLGDLVKNITTNVACAACATIASAQLSPVGIVGVDHKKNLGMLRLSEVPMAKYF